MARCNVTVTGMQLENYHDSLNWEYVKIYDT